MKNEQKGFAGMIVLIIAIVAIGAGIYAYSKNRPEISTPISDIQSTESTYFEVKELGIKFKLTDDIKDLTYVAVDNGKDKGGVIADFSTKSLTQAGGVDCAAKEGDGPLGAIQVIDTQNASNTEKEDMERLQKMKMLGTIGIYYTHPQATCSENKQIQDLAIRQMISFQKALETSVISN